MQQSALQTGGAIFTYLCVCVCVYVIRWNRMCMLLLQILNALLYEGNIMQPLCAFAYSRIE